MKKHCSKCDVEYPNFVLLIFVMENLYKGAKIMITIRNKEFSEDTIVEALTKHCNFEEETKPYIFQAKDVVTCNGYSRIILENPLCELVSFDVSDGKSLVAGQREFETYNYKKIGTLTDYINEKEN